MTTNSNTNTRFAICVLSISTLFFTFFFVPQSSSVAEPSPSNGALMGDVPLSPDSLTAGMVLKMSAAINTSGQWSYTKRGVNSVDEFSEFSQAQETLKFSSPTSFGDPDGDEFSYVYKKINNFSAQFTFKQTKAGGGDTLKNEYGTGKYIFLFTSFDAATNTLHGTVVLKNNYKGYGIYDKENVDGNFVDSTVGNGIFSLKLR